MHVGQWRANSYLQHNLGGVNIAAEWEEKKIKKICPGKQKHSRQ